MNERLLLQLVCLLTVCLTAQNVDAEGKNIIVRASTSQTFDDNITYTRSDRQSDFISLLMLGVVMKYENRKTIARLSTDISQQVFWRNSGQNNTAEAIEGQLKREITKYDRITMSDAFRHAYEPYNFQDQFERTTGRYGYYSNKFDVAYERDLNDDLSAKIGYGNDFDLKSRPDLIDSYTNRLSLQTDYDLTPKRTVFAGYDFVYRTIDPGDQSTTNTLSGGLRQYLTQTLNLETRLGADLIRSYNGERYSNPLFIATLTQQTSDREALSLSFSKRYSASSSTDDVFNSWQLSGGVRRQLRQRLSGSASIFFGKGEYVSLGIRDTLAGGSGGLSYDFYKNLRGNVSYSYSQTNSNFNEREYRKNVVSFGLSGEF